MFIYLHFYICSPFIVLCTQKFEVSPDGRVIAICGRYGNIHILNAHTKEWITSLKMNGEVTAICFSNDGSQLYSHGGI